MRTHPNDLVRNVWAVGRNYAAHAHELGNKIPVTRPLIFLKAGSCVSFQAPEIHLLPAIESVDHELEICLRLDSNLKPSSYALALDLTDRARQNELKKESHPWTLAKSFQGACPVTQFRDLTHLSELSDVGFQLKKNGVVCQDGNTRDMIYSFEKLVGYIQSIFPVCPGDLILTGTPSGVGPLVRGDLVEVQMEDRISHMWKVK